LARFSIQRRAEDEKIFRFIKTWYFGPLFCSEARNTGKRNSVFVRRTDISALLEMRYFSGSVFPAHIKSTNTHFVCLCNKKPNGHSSERLSPSSSFGDS